MVNDQPAAPVPAEPEPPSCFICYQADGRLISPCGCRGSIGQVHGHCLRRWQRYHVHEQRNCGVCLQPYVLSRSTRVPVPGLRRMTTRSRSARDAEHVARREYPHEVRIRIHRRRGEPMNFTRDEWRRGLEEWMDHMGITAVGPQTDERATLMAWMERRPARGGPDN